MEGEGPPLKRCRMTEACESNPAQGIPKPQEDFMQELEPFLDQFMEDETASHSDPDVKTGKDLEADGDLPGSEARQSVNGGFDDPQGEDQTHMSKNQLKKLKRKQDWEAARDARKVKRKERNKEKKARKREAQARKSINESLASASTPSAVPNGELENTSSMPVIEQPAQDSKSHGISHHTRAVQLPITFIIDCNFDNLMLEKEIMSLSAQITRSYSDNHRAPFKAHLMLSSFSGRLKERFDGVLAGQHQSWKGVSFVEEDFVVAAGQARERMSGEDGGEMAGVFDSNLSHSKVSSEHDENKANEDDNDADSRVLQQPFGPKEIIYLTSDSPHTLTTLHPHSTYIVGGLVDRNRHKGMCYKRAMDAGVKTARLPIGQYMEMTSRFVLATNHVCEIMLRWLECEDWGKAFLRVIPKRKGGVLKGVPGGGKEKLSRAEREEKKSLRAAREMEDLLASSADDHEEGDEEIEIRGAA
ncbi:tRNA (guanine(9)-N(1))-methyltransferase [Bachmanniomyces sp. S44760]|nr:tRNA (guanine(9)-N(1))-methyltransferase [Bachmanniomyces sp. S44760]